MFNKLPNLMNNVKTEFSIRDLENLSGVKAHTIRIWEKRYDVLSPMRSDTNIRVYDLHNLQKLLNITLLHRHGYKISKIATFDEAKIPMLVRQIMSEKTVQHHAINALKIAMMNFDQPMFLNTYNKLLSQRSFQEVFNEVFIPLLNEIGLLWQTDTISPAHEHFISYLIRQKIMTNTEKIQIIDPVKTDRVFVLFLPQHEIHELGLLYINYEITLHGYKSIYLGESLPVESLNDLKKHFNNIVFVSYFTVQPHANEVNGFVKRVAAEIMDATSELWLLGRNTEKLNPPQNPNIRLFTSITQLTANL